MEFIYCGEVEIQNEGLVKFLEAANELQIEGLQQKGGVNKRSGMEKVLEISTEKEKLDLQTQQKDVLGIPIKDEPFFESKVPNSEEQEMLDEGSMKEVEGDKYEEEEEKDVVFNEAVEDSTGHHMGYQQTEATSGHYDCEYCPATFIFIEELEDHVEIHHDVKKEMTDRDNISEIIASEEPWNIDDSGSKICKICDKVFSNKWTAQEHTESVHENIRFLCDYCDHMASSRRNVRGHIRKKHPDRELPSTYTKVKSDSVKAERREPKTAQKMKSSATDQVPEILEQDIDEKIETLMERRGGVWACKECEKVDKSKQAIKRHVETHLKEFSHSCPECSKVFTTRLNLKTHRDRNHKVEEIQDKSTAEENTKIPEEDIKRFQCNQCEKSPISLPALRTHTWRAHSSHAMK